MADEMYGALRERVAYQLDEATLTTVFNHANTSSLSRPRLIVQSVLMAVVGVISLIDFIAFEPHRGLSLFIAIAAAVVGVGQWFIMPFFRRSAVKQQLADNETIRLSVFDKGLGFGEAERMMFYPFDRCRLIREPELMIVQIDREFVGIPHREISEETQCFLADAIPAKDSDKKEKM